MTAIFLIDDHEMVRRGLADLLTVEPDFQIVGEAATAAEAIDRVPKSGAEVAVVDVRLPDGSGIEVCRELRSVVPALVCVMLTSYDDEQALLAAAMAGAAGYFLKDIKGNDLVDVVRRVAAGESLLDKTTVQSAVKSAHVSEGDLLEPLSPQERRILDHISEGMTNREIAASMFLAEKTVKNYVSNLLMKLGMTSRTEAAVFATRLAERKRHE